ncbi:class I SAM-dependent methyltransferase [Pedobacter changchengzhani]|uniref:Class I SAM-dependent methyltransferase n=1 Tax=Pedobacter changchengzhani TaxID=2529274 RepID=A0A4R5MIF1_9SPHI|nr:class I SAM-dependent methyltransferase [Pedobacter changchengzhani]TDG35301.1 class I SAM-dependent methyltransferase [Pedobacter changchengzhani]
MKELYDKKNISYYSHTRPELLKFLPKTFTSILDIGCAGGNFGQMLKELYKCEVWGVEPGENSAKIASTKLDKVYHGPFDNETDIPANKQFDCIFFNDVLEHLAQPEEALLLATKYLSPTGCIIASIPNIRFYPAIISLLRHKDFKYLDAGVMDKTHLRFFTKKSMIRLFEESNYIVKTVEGINRHTFKYLEILNFFLLKSIDDMHYPQYAIVATKNE